MTFMIIIFTLNCAGNDEKKINPSPKKEAQGLAPRQNIFTGLKRQIGLGIKSPLVTPSKVQEIIKNTIVEMKREKTIIQGRDKAPLGPKIEVKPERVIRVIESPKVLNKAILAPGKKETMSPTNAAVTNSKNQVPVPVRKPNNSPMVGNRQVLSDLPKAKKVDEQPAVGALKKKDTGSPNKNVQVDNKNPVMIAQVKNQAEKEKVKLLLQEKANILNNAATSRMNLNKKFSVGRQVNVREDVQVDNDVKQAGATKPVLLAVQKSPVVNPSIKMNIAKDHPAPSPTDSSFVDIAWEMGMIKSYLVQRKKGELYSHLKSMIIKANAVLRMYIDISTPEKYDILIRAGKLCDRNISNDLKIEAKLLMIARIFEPKDGEEEIMARATFCVKDGDSNRTKIGNIEFNINAMINQQAANYLQDSYVMTIVHEVLHALAFHSNQDNLINKKDIGPQFTHLNQIKRSGLDIYDNGHWIEQFVPGDIMVDVNRFDSILSIYSLELIGHASADYITKKENLSSNLFLDTLESEKDFMDYRCTDDDVGHKYDHVFCSAQESTDDRRTCSKDYQFQTACEETILSNNCYKRVTVPGGNCGDPEVLDDEGMYEFEKRGPESRCFSDSADETAYCLRFAVVDSRVNILVGEQTIECKKSFEPVIMNYKKANGRNLSLSIKCPDLADFISQYRKTSCPNNCHRNGFCSNGQCLCFSGFDSKSNCKLETHQTSKSLIFSEVLK